METEQVCRVYILGRVSSGELPYLLIEKTWRFVKDFFGKYKQENEHLVPPELKNVNIVLAGCHASPGKASWPLAKFTKGSLNFDKTKQFTPLSKLVEETTYNHQVGEITILAMANPLHFIACKTNLLKFIEDMNDGGIPLTSIFFFAIGLKVEKSQLCISPVMISLLDFKLRIESPNEESNDPISQWLNLIKTEIWRREVGSKSNES